MDVCRFGFLYGTVMLICVAGPDVQAADGVLRFQSPVDVDVPPLLDDATIRAIDFVGRDRGWAVGDRGVVWKTVDGGNSWSFVSLGEELANYVLYDVCFLTDRIGWMCGGTVARVGRVHQGVVLFTSDAGKSWQVIAHGNLPCLHSIRFFDAEYGIAAGERTAEFPAGALQTVDGGRTWSPLSASGNQQWEAAAFFDARSGVFVAAQGRQFNFANGQLYPGTGSVGGLQTLRSVSATSRGTSWIVGDGALALSSTDHGVSWEIPDLQLPQGVEDCTEFLAVAQFDSHVWITGMPGAVVFHSTDFGSSWERQFTGGTTPLRSIEFQDPMHGVAAGDLGRICVTQDGGATWREVRGAGRRLAALTIHAHQSRIPFQLLTRWARESGFRMGVKVLSRRDLGSDGHRFDESDLRQQFAVMTAGGSVSDLDWRLPINVPGLDRNPDALAQSWSDLTDRRLHDVLSGQLVGQIRMWQPEVIVIDEPATDDAATQLLVDTLPRVIDLAADPTAFPEQVEVGLSAWQVKKVVMERTPGRQGTIRQREFEVLPHLETTLDVATHEAAVRLLDETEFEPGDRSYEVIYVAPDRGLGAASLFSDLHLGAGTATRRRVPTLNSMNYDQLIDAARHRKTMTALSQRLIDSPEHGAQLLGQLQEILKPLSAEQAARQLADLGLKYRQAGQWALAEETYAQLILNYSDQPAALEAMIWLVEYTTSAEMNWQRLRSMQASRSSSQVSPAIVQANFQQAIEIVGKNATQLGRKQALQSLEQPFEREATQLMPVIGRSIEVANGQAMGANQYELQLERWRETASNIVKDLSQAYPRLFEQDEMQFVIAALMRRKRQGRKADEIYDRYLQRLSEDDPWHVAARGEAYLLRPGVVSPKPVITCGKTALPPVLDGRLVDPCWEQAGELELTDRSQSGDFVGTNLQAVGTVEYRPRRPVIMLTRDERYLYVGGSVPKDATFLYEATQHPGRPRDGDLGKHDRVSIQLDIDRDYATYYRFEVDQRGWTREACWDAWNYNPDWYVATEQDDSSWTFEVAIPLQELLPSEPSVEQTWAVGVTRIVPGKFVQSWTDSGGDIPLPPRFGLMRFN